MNGLLIKKLFNNSLYTTTILGLIFIFKNLIVFFIKNTLLLLLILNLQTLTILEILVHLLLTHNPYIEFNSGCLLENGWPIIAINLYAGEDLYNIYESLFQPLCGLGADLVKPPLVLIHELVKQISACL